MDWEKVYYKKIKYIASNAKKRVHFTSFSICIEGIFTINKSRI